MMLKIKWLNNPSQITMFQLYFSFKRITGEAIYNHHKALKKKKKKVKHKKKKKSKTQNYSLHFIYDKAMHSYINFKFNKA